MSGYGGLSQEKVKDFKVGEMEGDGEEALIVFGKEIPRQLTWIFKFRIVDIAVLTTLLGLFFAGELDVDANTVVPPQVDITVGGTTTSIEDPEHYFPLKVDDTWCTATDFEACGGVLSSSGCCADQDFQETVSSTALGWLLIGIPLIFVFLRYFALRTMTKAPVTRFFDSLVALMATWFIVGIVTSLVKNYVGYPRPNYYALLAYADLHDNAGARAAANRSFPSGHSSESMGGMAFLALTLLVDLRVLGLAGRGLVAPAPAPGAGAKAGPPVVDRGVVQPCSALAAYALALAPFGVAIFVGASRVRDYFHFPADVLAGLAVGLAAAAFGVLVAAPARALHTRAARPAHTRDEARHLLSEPLIEPAAMFKV
mmetsp:Transcript_31806/g.49917  ORF Transcript_31806/g.49917 Transcript_31806/m.49917 type:complete len:370 (-) Transcript_31806:44-1153(-)